MNNEELDSQLSAMFDNELPPGECELLARRLSRDPDIKARWGRYAVIGAVIRAERGVALEGIVAGRVSAALSSEPALSVDAAQPSGSRIPYRWWQPIAGVGLAAGVAAVSILRRPGRRGASLRGPHGRSRGARRAGAAERHRTGARQLRRAARIATIHDDGPRHGAGRLRRGPQRLLLARQPRKSPLGPDGE